jgi:hypothetical protein
MNAALFRACTLSFRGTYPPSFPWPLLPSTSQFFPLPLFLVTPTHPVTFLLTTTISFGWLMAFQGQIKLLFPWLLSILFESLYKQWWCYHWLSHTSLLAYIRPYSVCAVHSPCCLLLAGFTLQLWKQRRYIPPKRQWTSIKLRTVTTVGTSHSQTDNPTPTVQQTAQLPQCSKRWHYLYTAACNQVVCTATQALPNHWSP